MGAIMLIVVTGLVALAVVSIPKHNIYEEPQKFLESSGMESVKVGPYIGNSCFNYTATIAWNEVRGDVCCREAGCTFTVFQKVNWTPKPVSR